MNIVNITKDCFNCIILFLSTDDIYPFMETCKFFNLFIKEYKNRNKNFLLIQPQPYYIAQSIQMIEWAKSHSKFKYSTKISQFVSRRNNFKLLKYVYKDGCEINYMVLAEAIENENIKIINWFFKNNSDIADFPFHKACEVGNIDIIKILKNNNIHGNYQSLSCSYAVLGNNLDLLKWLIQNGYQFNKSSYIEAVRNGNLKILKYLLNLSQHNLNYPWIDSTITAEAAKNGKLTILKWLRKKGCRWDEFTTYLAYEYKRINTLKWAIENGCPIYNGVYENLNEHGINIERSKCNII